MTKQNNLQLEIAGRDHNRRFTRCIILLADHYDLPLLKELTKHNCMIVLFVVNMVELLVEQLLLKEL